MPVEEVIEASLDHGVAHYTRCPWDFATHLRLYASAKEVLQDREMAQRATDTFIDVVSDTFCVKELETVLPKLYRHIERGPLDTVMAALYSRIWGVDLESTAPEGLIRRLSRIAYLDRSQWEESMRRFCRLIRPILEEEQQQQQGMSSAPLGQHGLAGHSQNEVEQGLREFARQVANPREFRETVEDFAEDLAEQGYSEAQEGMGRGKGPQLDTDLLYYMKLAESYHLPVRKAPLQKSSSSDPYAHTPWEIGKPIQDIDVWTSFGKILPGLTQTWLRQHGEVVGQREGVPDCLVVIDSSGSMTNPRYLLSYAILGAGCACEAYLRNGAQVAVYNFSDAPAGDSLSLDFTTDRRHIYQALCRYFGGGTALALEEFDELRRRASRGAPDVFLITDMAITNLEMMTTYLSQIDGRITAVHIGETESALHFKKAVAGWKNVSVFPVGRKEDIPRIILGQVKEYLRPGQFGG
jgi:Mg-chelatase subunit ChlD